MKKLVIGSRCSCLLMLARWVSVVCAQTGSGSDEGLIPLQIIIQPQSVGVGIGRDARLSVVADGTAPISYQWQFMGTPLPGETNATLTLTDTDPAQAGPYSATVSNASGTLTSATAFLSIQGVVGWGLPPYGVFDIPPTFRVTNVVAISCGTLHTLVLREDGAVLAWGDNRLGQLDVPADLTNAVAIAAGDTHNLALQADGKVVAWGGGNAGGETSVPAGLTNVAGLAAGTAQSFAIRADGTVSMWGDVTNVPAGLSNVVAISASARHGLALQSDGTVIQWGDLGWSSSEGTLHADVPSGLSNVVAVAVGGTHSLALKADGTVVAWGLADMGGTNVPPDLTKVVAIAAGNSHSLALRADGTIVEWGFAPGDPLPTNLPDVVAISTKAYFSMALLRDGAPHLTVEPWDQVVTPASSPKFRAMAVGRQSMTCQWQFNGNDIAGATNQSLVIANARSAAMGYYSLVASNLNGTAVSRRAKLVIRDATGPTPPVVSRITAVESTASIIVSSSAAQQYQLEYKDSLSDAVWTPVLPWTLGTGGQLILTDTNAMAETRFYRIQSK